MALHSHPYSNSERTERKQGNDQTTATNKLRKERNQITANITECSAMSIGTNQKIFTPKITHKNVI